MFGSETDRKNDLYGWIDAAAPELLRASRELVENNEAYRVSDEAVAQILTAAIRLYVAKSDGEERTFPPIAGERDSEMTPTELCRRYPKCCARCISARWSLRCGIGGVRTRTPIPREERS